MASESTAFQMTKVAALPNGEEITLAEIIVENYKKVFKGVDPNLPLLSIAITGAMRSGKSFLINLFAKYLEYIQQDPGSDEGWETSRTQIDGIKWAGGTDAVTQGIWMWNKPFVIKQEDGTKVAIALIDIQGLGDSRNASKAVDNLLMYVGLQICNLQIINVKGNNNTTEFEKLSNCFTYAEINDRASSAFGTLVFLIRDFTLGGEENYGQDDTKFDNMLAGARFEDVRRQMSKIKNNFQKVTTFNMPLPSNKVMQSGANASKLTVDVEDIGEPFLNHCKNLFSSLIQADVPRDNTVQHAIRLFEGLKSRIIGHENGLPDPESSAIDIAVNRTYMKAEKHFENSLIEEKIDYTEIESETKIKEIYEKLRGSARQVFNEQCTYRDELGKFQACYSKYLAALENHIDESLRLQLSNYREKVKADIEKENEVLKERERQQKEAAQIKIKELNEKIHKLEVERERLEGINKTTLAELDAEKKLVKKMEVDLEKNAALIADQNRDLSNNQENMSKMLAENSEIEGKVIRLEEQLTSCGNTIKKLEEDLGKSSDLVKEQKRDLRVDQEKMSKMSAEKNEAKEEAIKLTEQLTASGNKVEFLEGERKKQAVTIQRLQDDKNELQERIDNLSDEKGDVKGEIKAMEAKLEAEKDTVEQLRKEKLDSQSEIAKMRSDIDNLQRQLAESKEQKGEAEGKVEFLEGERKKEAVTIQRLQNDKEELQERIDVLSTEKGDVNGEIKAIQVKLEAEKKLVEQLKEEKLEYQSDIAKMRSEIDNLQRQLAETKEQKGDAEGKVEFLEGERKKEAVTIQRLQNDKDELQERIENLSNEKGDVKGEIQAIQVKLEAEKNTVEQLREEKLEYQSDIAKMRSEIDNLQRQMLSQTENMGQAQGKVDKLEKQLKEKQQEIFAMTNERETVRQESIKYQTQFEVASSEGRQLDEQLKLKQRILNQVGEIKQEFRRDYDSVGLFDRYATVAAKYLDKLDKALLPLNTKDAEEN